MKLKVYKNQRRRENNHRHNECEILGRGVAERRKDWRQRCRLGVISTMLQPLTSSSDKDKDNDKDKDKDKDEYKDRQRQIPFRKHPCTDLRQRCCLGVISTIFIRQRQRKPKDKEKIRSITCSKSTTKSHEQSYTICHKPNAMSLSKYKKVHRNFDLRLFCNRE